MCIYVIGAATSQRWPVFDAMTAHSGLKIEKVFSDPNPSYPPCLAGEKPSYAALWGTYGRLWSEALEKCSNDYIVVLEDDIGSLSADTLQRTLARASKVRAQVVWMDPRTPYTFDCCTMGMAYRRDILPDLIAEFNVSNPRAYWNNTTSCKTDLYLAAVVQRHNFLSLKRPVVYTQDDLNATRFVELYNSSRNRLSSSLK